MYPADKIVEHLISMPGYAFLVFLDGTVVTPALVRSFGSLHFRIHPLILEEELAHVLRYFTASKLLVHGDEYLGEREQALGFSVLQRQGTDFLEQIYQITVRLRWCVDAHHLALFALDLG